MQTRWPAPNCEGVLVSKRIEQQERLYGLAGGKSASPKLPEVGVVLGDSKKHNAQ
jgi:hypothetical protein